MKKCVDIIKRLRESDKEDFFGHPILVDEFHRMISLVITNALTYNASSEHGLEDVAEALFTKLKKMGGH